MPLIRPALPIASAPGGVRLAAPVSAQQVDEPHILVFLADALGSECRSPTAVQGGVMGGGPRSCKAVVPVCIQATVKVA